MSERESRWALSVVDTARPEPIPPAVVHHGHEYWGRFTVEWTREDALQVRIEAVMDEKLGPIARRVTVEDLMARPDPNQVPWPWPTAPIGQLTRGVAAEVRLLPIPTMLKSGAVLAIKDESKWEKTGEEDEGGHPLRGRAGGEVRMGPLPKPRARRAETAERLREAARAYKAAVKSGQPVGDRVAADLCVSRSQAYQLIWQARQQKLLPKTRRGLANSGLRGELPPRRNRRRRETGDGA